VVNFDDEAKDCKLNGLYLLVKPSVFYIKMASKIKILLAHMLICADKKNGTNLNISRSIHIRHF